MNNYQKQHRGFTLLELLLVLLVVAAILLASYSRYRHYSQEKDIAIIKQNVALMQQFEDVCYATMMANKDPRKTPVCEATIRTSFNRASCEQLVKNYNLNLNSSALVQGTSADYYQLGSDTDISVKAPQSDPCGSGKYYNHRLTVSVKLDNTKVPSTTYAWYKNMLGADSNQDSLFIWQKLPSYSVAAIGDSLWIMGAGLRIFKKRETVPAGS